MSKSSRRIRMTDQLIEVLCDLRLMLIEDLKKDHPPITLEYVKNLPLIDDDMDLGEAQLDVFVEGCKAGAFQFDNSVIEATLEYWMRTRLRGGSPDTQEASYTSAIVLALLDRYILPSLK